MKAILTGLIRKCVAPTAMKAALAIGAVGSVPAAAQAHHHDRPHLRVDVGCVDVRVGLPVVVTPAPVCVAPPTQVWVAPVYQTVTERVWTPDRYEVRDIFRGRRVFHESVCVEPGHFDLVTHQQLVCAGHFETVGG